MHAVKFLVVDLIGVEHGCAGGGPQFAVVPLARAIRCAEFRVHVRADNLSPTLGSRCDLRQTRMHATSHGNPDRVGDKSDGCLHDRGGQIGPGDGLSVVQQSIFQFHG